MKPKGLLIAVGLLAVLGGFSWWAYKHPADASKTGAEAGGAPTKLLTIPDDQFKEIKIAKLTGETIDLKKEDGKWKMVEPKQLPADQDAAGAMQSTLNSLSSEKLIEDKATDLKPYGLDRPTLDIQIFRAEVRGDLRVQFTPLPEPADPYYVSMSP